MTDTSPAPLTIIRQDGTRRGHWGSLDTDGLTLERQEAMTAELWRLRNQPLNNRKPAPKRGLFAKLFGG
jgi:hypothetical protein